MRAFTETQQGRTGQCHRQIGRGLLRRVMFVLAVGVVPVTILSGCGGGSGGDGGGSGSQAPFTLAAETSASATQNSGFLLPVDLTRHSSFSGTVEVTLDNPPAGVQADTIVFSGETTSAVLPIRVTDQAALGNHSLSLTGKSPSASHGVSITLAVSAAQSTAQEKIAEALQAGTLEYGTSLLYRAYALFGDRRLPNEYEGPSGEEDSGLFEEIQETIGTFPSDMQAKLQAFMVRPADSTSVWNMEAPTATSVAALDMTPHLGITLPTPPPTAPPAQCSPESGSTRKWASKRSPTHPVRVWAQCRNNPDYNVQSEELIDQTLKVIDKIYEPMTNLMGQPILDEDGGDNAIDFYILDTLTYVFRNNSKLGMQGPGVAYALKKRVNDGPSDKSRSSVVTFQRWKASLVSFHLTIIHEFFHVLQNSHNGVLKYRPVAGGGGVRESYWFIEASAEWAAAHYNRELKPWRDMIYSPHFTFAEIFQKSNKGLNALAKNGSGDYHAYSAYIWPYFVEQEKGGSNFMTQIWKGLESVTTFEQADDVIDSVYPFTDNFKRFALRNLNMALLPGDPLPKSDRYVSLDPEQFPDGVGPKLVGPAVLVADQLFQQSLELEPLSARYVPVVSTSGVKRVELDFTGLKPQDLTDIHLLVRTTDSKGIPQWVAPPFDDSSADKVVFCLSEGPTTPSFRGDFGEIIIVVSNHGKRDKVSGNLVARPVSKPCVPVWAGNVKLHTTTSTGNEFTFTAETTFEFDDTLPQESTAIPYRLRSGSYSFDDRIIVDSSCTSTTHGGGPMVKMPFVNPSIEGSTKALMAIDTGRKPPGLFVAAETATIGTHNDCRGNNSLSHHSVLWGIIFPGEPGQVVSDNGNTIKGSRDLAVPGDSGNTHIEYEFTKSGG